jgi:hypothetical protein
MAAEEDLFILGDWESLLDSKGELRKQLGGSSLLSATERTRSSGKQRVTFEVRSEPILVDCNEQRMGQPIANAIAEQVKEQLRNTSDRASAGTRAARARAAKAFDEGKAWALKEYAGGQLGPMRPDPTSIRKGNDSGRLGRSFRMQFAPKTGEYMLNVAANRLTADFRARNPEFIPWLANRVIQPALTSEKLDEAIAKALGDSVMKVRDARAAARKRLMDNARQLVDATRGVAGAAQQFGDSETETGQ